MARIIGMKGHKARLKKIRGPVMVREVDKAVYAAADYLSTEAALSITAGAVSGKGHVPSVAPDPPNADTHVLDRSIHSEKVGPLVAHSVADAPYAVDQEMGNSRLPARPYMRPAAQKTRPKAQQLVTEAVKRVVKGQSL